MNFPLDIIDRLNDPELAVDAIDDAVKEIEKLRQRVDELESAQRNTKVHGKVHGFESTAAILSRRN